jgi:D-glycero-alpha-D-manno-heptose-7-phosphate kinase
MKHSSLAGHKYKISYRELDESDEIRNIRHPVVRNVLEKLKWKGGGLHISTMSDVPAGTGLGSSSSFTVGLLKLIQEFEGRNPSNKDLALQAINIEREILKEYGGLQDQYHASFGGLAAYEFTKKKISTYPIKNSAKLNLISDSMFLVPIGKPRKSTDIAEKWDINSNKNFNEIELMAVLAREVFNDFNMASDPEMAFEILSSGMQEAWQMKRKLSQTDPQVDAVVNQGIKAGASAAKLCGAGGSGFVLFMVHPNKRIKFEKLFALEQIHKVKIEPKGTRIENYSGESLIRN